VVDDHPCGPDRGGALLAARGAQTQLRRLHARGAGRDRRQDRRRAQDSDRRSSSSTATGRAAGTASSSRTCTCGSSGRTRLPVELSGHRSAERLASGSSASSSTASSIYSTNGRLLAKETDGNKFTLPTPRPALGDASLHNSAPTLDKTDVAYKSYRLFFKLTPTPDLEFKAEYSLIDKSGHRPFGMAFGSPGNDFYEILEPIDQQIHEFRVTGGISREMWQLQGGYTLSMFENRHAGVYAALQAGEPEAAPASDNMVTLHLGGGVTCPSGAPAERQRLYSIQLRTTTSCPTSTLDRRLGAGRGSPDGRVDVLNLFLNAVTRCSALTLSAKYGC
jgi:hypothetical protein